MKNQIIDYSLQLTEIYQMSDVRTPGITVCQMLPATCYLLNVSKGGA